MNKNRFGDVFFLNLSINNGDSMRGMVVILWSDLASKKRSFSNGESSRKKGFSGFFWTGGTVEPLIICLGEPRGILMYFALEVETLRHHPLVTLVVKNSVRPSKR